MYIVARLTKRNKKEYKTNGKGEKIRILPEDKEDGVDFAQLQTFQTEEEAITEAERRIEENPHQQYIVFTELTRLVTEKPAIKYIDMRAK